MILMGAAMLSACGLKGPLYLPEEDPDSKPTLEQDSPADVKDSENEDTGI